MLKFAIPPSDRQTTHDGVAETGTNILYGTRGRPAAQRVVSLSR